MSSRTKRLSLLNPDEIQALFGLPCFSVEERESYFSLDPDETLIVESLRHTHAKLLFLLQLGYFKASHQFFVITWQDVQFDLDYLMARYFSGKTGRHPYRVKIHASHNKK